jgi:hypothetical protein
MVVEFVGSDHEDPFDRVAGVKRALGWVAAYAACVTLAATTGGCEVVAIVSAAVDDGYPPPPVYLDPCPYVLSRDAPTDDDRGRFAEITTSASGIDASTLIAKDEDLVLLVSSTGTQPSKSFADAEADGPLEVDDATMCVDDRRRVIVDLSTPKAGTGTVFVVIGEALTTPITFEIAEPASLELSYEPTGQIRAHVRDEAGRELFADSSIEWEATPNGFSPSSPTRGLFAPALFSTAPTVTLFAYRGDLMASMRLRYENGLYVPDTN